MVSEIFEWMVVYDSDDIWDVFSYRNILFYRFICVFWKAELQIRDSDSPTLDSSHKEFRSLEWQQGVLEWLQELELYQEH